ncbi:uncharacterized protein SPPG_01013 [Spizellomyces punctatus DAOM BR117]|uniref:STEEP1 domain-containing protein n=1 Tax=Spizellomyces punctatus (strain DAOM BR117) TaxID=645134 RepID=A0A0L0HR21_SPIPD|nr:uncharacterized protein SPPG_01013 [Spizellomyces punctatus DAOM BR117]KND03532.1 hypothetical protein SPPG_01013 [Spizellomyces punctatus DAOM BR117]|eukprot:XP_016611571.1 hypothetical protein SPPG_01013 [Spizellomyces punctatus DAOM BR117]
MPKIVSSSTISASAEFITGAEKALHVYYCHYCGEYVLIVDKRLHKLPRRRTDNASIISDKRTFKLNLKRGPTKIIKRAAGYERQSRWSCPRCDLPVAYDQDSGPVYIFDGAVHGGTSAQGPDESRRQVLGESKVEDHRPAQVQMTAEQLLREAERSRERSKR